MALVIANRVREASATIGTGAMSLLGAALGYQSFAAAVGTGNTTYYAIVSGAGQWEIGLGTVVGTELQRTTVLDSSSGGSLVNFAPGTKDVFATLPANIPALVEDLAATGAGKGAEMVAFKQSGTGAVDTTVAAVLNETVSVKRFGAVGDGVTDDTAAIQETADSFGVYGGAFTLLNKTYKTTSPIIIQYPTRFFGSGGIYSGINPSGAGVNALTISPSTASDSTMASVGQMHIGDPATGLRSGAVGVYLNTLAAGQNLPKFTLRDVVIGQGSDFGFKHENLTASNVNGGLYCATIENSVIKGGVRLDSSGDSNNVVSSILTGQNIGVSASLVPGASLLKVEANNITNDGGAVLLDAGSRFRLSGNNCENSAAGAAAQNDGALFNIRGSNGTMYGGVITENLLSVFGSTDATRLLRLKNSRGTLVQDNVFLSGVGGVTPIVIESDCKDIRIGANTYAASFTPGAQVLDNGEGTMGVVKTATLQNGWVAYGAGQATLKFIKAIDGIVHLYGAIKDGVTATGTVITQLPIGFRPSEIMRFPALVINAGTPQPCQITIETDGTIRVNFALSSDQLCINVSFPAENLANAISLE